MPTLTTPTTVTFSIQIDQVLTLTNNFGVGSVVLLAQRGGDTVFDYTGDQLRNTPIFSSGSQGIVTITHLSGSLTYDVTSSAFGLTIPEVSATRALVSGVGTVVVLPTGTNDQVAINAAIVAQNAAGGGVVQLVAGTYDIASAVLIRSNVWLRGSGAATVLRLKNATPYANASNVVFGQATGANLTGFSITDLTLDGNRSNQTLGSTQDNAFNGICVRGDGTGTFTSRNFRIENVTATACGYHGIAVYEGCVNFKVSNNYLFGNGFRGIHVHASDAQPSTEYQILGNRVTANGVDTTTGLQTGILTGLFVALSNVSRASVMNNTIWAELGPALEITGYAGPDVIAADSNVFTGNTIFDCGMGATFSAAIRNISFTGNVIKNCNTTAKGAGASGQGIQFRTAGTLGARGISIVGNTIADCSSWGVNFDAASGKWSQITIASNTIQNCGTNTGSNTGGVRLNTVDSSTVTGNTIYQNNSGSGAPRQMYIFGTTNTVIVGNVIDGGTANFPVLEADSTSSNIVCTGNYINRNSGSGTGITFAAANSFAFGNIFAGTNTLNNTGTGNAGARFDITTAAGANTATMTNSPVSGNPSAWVTVNVGGTSRVIPAW